LHLPLHAFPPQKNFLTLPDVHLQLAPSRLKPPAAPAYCELVCTPRLLVSVCSNKFCASSLPLNAARFSFIAAHLPLCRFLLQDVPPTPASCAPPSPCAQRPSFLSGVAVGHSDHSQQQCSSWAVMSSFMLPSSAAVRPWDRLQLPEDIRLALFKAAECGRGRQSAAECGRVRRRAEWQEKRCGNEG
jgi:hypothetical protein